MSNDIWTYWPQFTTHAPIISNARFTVSTLMYFHCFVSSAIPGFQQGGAFKGLTTENDQIKVTKKGVYYIYAQVFFESYPGGPDYHNRVALTVNGGPFALLQTGLDNRGDYGSVYTGGVINLKPGDMVGLKTVYDSRLWVSAKHTFFGAHKIA